MTVSKTVANWTLVVRTLVSAIRQFGPDLAGRLEAELFPDGPPRTLTVADILTALADALERRLATATAADQALAVERADDDAARDARDDANTSARGLVTNSRSAVEGTYGRGAVVRSGLDGRLPDGIDQLVSQMRTVAQLLPALDESPTIIPGTSLDTGALASAIGAAADLLAQRNANVQRESREEQDALHARDSALDAVSSGYGGLADAFVGLCIFGGRPDAAERARATANRRVGRPEPDDIVDPSAAPEGGAPGAGGSDGGPGAA